MDRFKGFLNWCKIDGMVRKYVIIQAAITQEKIKDDQQYLIKLWL